MYSLDDLLTLMVNEDADELELRPNVVPIIHIKGVMHSVEGPALRPNETEGFALEIAPGNVIADAKSTGNSSFIRQIQGFKAEMKVIVTVSTEDGHFGLSLKKHG